MSTFYKQIIDTALHSGRAIPNTGHATLILFRDEEQIARWTSFAASDTESARIITVPLHFISSIVTIPPPLDKVYLIGVGTSQHTNLSDTILKFYRILQF